MAAATAGGTAECSMGMDAPAWRGVRAPASRCRTHIFTITGKVLFAGVLLGMGFFWAAVFAQSRLTDVLPHA
ncbi:hypothetical protein [Nitrosospira sp. Nsp18]|nr:hypothetical protein [Nitrosospira sp. Nsp18]